LAIASRNGYTDTRFFALRPRAPRAQALIEFALATSVFMLLVLGTFDMARAYLAYTVAANAAREASRYGVAHVGESGWQQSAAQAGRNLAVGVDSSALTLIATSADIGALTYITVTGTYQFRALTPFVGSLLGNPIIMRVETSALAG
jgi:hypothetical protein